MKKCFINELANYLGKEICEYFVLKSITTHSSENNIAKEKCVFSDNTGTVIGMLWPESYSPEYKKLEGNIVKVQGTVSLFEGQPQITISNILKGSEKDYVSDDFVYNLDPEIKASLINEFRTYFHKIQNKQIINILNNLFTEKMINKLCSLPGDIKVHHMYNGGLFVNTLNVVRRTYYDLMIEDANSKIKPNYSVPVNFDIALAGAMILNIGKVFEFNPYPVGTKTSKSLKTGFINEGTKLLNKAFQLAKVADPDMNDNILDDLIHIITSSHLPGYSPQPPHTKEAIIVYYANLQTIGIDSIDTSFYQHNLVHIGNSDTVIYSNFFKTSICKNESEEK